MDLEKSTPGNYIKGSVRNTKKVSGKEEGCREQHLKLCDCNSQRNITVWIVTLILNLVYIFSNYLFYHKINKIYVWVADSLQVDWNICWQYCTYINNSKWPSFAFTIALNLLSTGVHGILTHLFGQIISRGHKRFILVKQPSDICKTSLFHLGHVAFSVGLMSTHGENQTDFSENSQKCLLHQFCFEQDGCLGASSQVKTYRLRNMTDNQGNTFISKICW